MSQPNRQLADTDLEVFPLCLGGNVFGWTADETSAFAVLDAYAAAGGNFVDTADQYVSWVAGRSGGESEAIIGRWMARRGNRDRMIVATKVGEGTGVEGLSRDTIRRAAEASLERLGTDRIDLYYAHLDDPRTPLEETLGELNELIEEGKVRYLGASNYGCDRLAEALAVSVREGIARYVAVQPHYNLLFREEYEGPYAELCEREHITCIPYHALANGFLTGKYRSASDANLSPRGGAATSYLDERGIAVLTLLDEISASRETSVAAVALAWLAAQPTVVAPIASARDVDQLADLVTMAELELSNEELSRLRLASDSPRA